MTTETPTWQLTADTIADELTADQITELCSLIGLDLAEVNGETRQDTADNITRTLATSGRLNELEKAIFTIEPTLAPEEAKPKGVTYDGPPIDLKPGEASSAGTLGEANERASNRIVNSGFVDEDNPNQKPRERDRNLPLYTDTDYYFWLNVGEMMAGSIETENIELETADLPVGSRFKVALYDFKNELIITRGKDIGELMIQADGSIAVSQQVATPDGVNEKIATERLFFPVKTPTAEGTHRLRCNIYYKQVLLQSRLVTVTTSDDPEPSKDIARRSDLDFVISKTLTYQLDKIPEHRLSIMMNDNDDSTHGFRFFGNDGGDDFKNDTSFDAHELQNLITLARGALRKAAWGDEKEYTGQDYRYNLREPNINQLRIDLIRCAKRGYRIYDTLINRIAGDADKAWDLADMMMTPGQVQIANKASARLVIPSALIYDYPLDTSLGGKEIKLCPEFEQALKKKTPLETTDCFTGNCPSAGDDDHICPSGFWGYRHMIGMPVTVPSGPDAPLEIKIDGQREITMAVSTDPNFVGREAHEKKIKSLHPQLTYNYADERAETLDDMKKTSPNVLYFFCHGIFSGSITYLQVGPPKSRGISRDQLRQKRIRWRKTRPLVFINGCHTAALSPERAMDLVGGFIDTSHAAGVIGTEITNFVPVATVFGEECLRRFMVEGESIGEAVRAGRLKLLQQGNPLGLIYVPYVMTGLKLVE